jgi:energy-coupling factor transport system ATP-binding protein
LERVLRYVDRITYLENGRITVDEPVETAVAQIPQLPPLVRLGRELGWQPLPLTVKAGKRFARNAGGQWSRGAEEIIPPAPLRPRSPAILEANEVSFAYNGRFALNQVSLQVNPGETVAVMGRNGAGKSTLLKCLMGLLEPQSGEVVMNGRRVNGRDVADISREAAYLPQNPDDLLFAESVTDELTITLRNHNLLHKNGVPGMLQQLGLAEMAAEYPRDLSVGQRQRVALGAVTITRPRLLLLDEPTRGLDYQAKASLVSIWQQWLAEGMGLLLVTHDVELVAQIADRVVLLSQGEVIAAGPTAEILATSPLFAPQIARLFPDSGWLTVEDALAGMGDRVTR